MSTDVTVSTHNILYQQKRNFSGYFVLSVIVSLFTFSYFSPMWSSGIDGPLPWVFNYFFDGHLEMYKGINFPHGPLAFLIYPVNLGSNLYIAIFIHLILRAALTFGFFLLYNGNGKSRYIVPMALGFFFCSLFEIQFLLVGLMMQLFALFFLSEKKLFALCAIVLSAILVYIKAFGAVTASFMTCSFYLFHLIRERNLKTTLLFIGTHLFSVTIIWLLIFHHFSGMGNYFRGLIELSSDNSSAVGLYPQNNALLLSASVLCLLLVPFSIRQESVWRLYFLLLLPFFACWKYAVARQDMPHYLSYVFVLLFFFALIWLIAKKFNLLSLLLCVSSATLFYTNSVSFDYGSSESGKTGINSLCNFVMNRKKILENYDYASRSASYINTLDTLSRLLIKNSTVDVYPWDYSFVPANQLNWVPRPVLQSYASYTPWLDEQNAKHFSSDKAPEFIIWELDKITTDPNGGNFESIDNRYLLNDEPRTIMAIFRNYTVIRKNHRLMILRKKAALKGEGVFLAEEKNIKSEVVKWNTWVKVPQTPNAVLRAGISVNSNFMGTAKSLLYKGEQFYILYKLNTGEVLRYRFVPKNAADGLWINPLISHPENSYLEHNTEQILLCCSDKTLMKQEIRINWYSAEPINNRNKENDPNVLFKKNRKNEDSVLFYSQNSAETSLKNWFCPDYQLAGDHFASAPQSFKMKANEYGLDFSVNCDSSFFAKKKDFIIHTNLMIKASVQTEAVICISVFDSSEKIVQNTKYPLKEMIIDNMNWNFIRLNHTVDYALRKKARKIRVFIWNLGKETIYADDMTVSGMLRLNPLNEYIKPVRKKTDEEE